MRFFLITALFCAIISLFCALILYLLHPPDVFVQRVKFSSPTGATLVGDLYLPVNGTDGETGHNGAQSSSVAGGLLPAALLCHGVEANKEVMGHLGVEFARRGVAALAFDYGGYGESSPHDNAIDLMVADSAAALKFLYSRQETFGPGMTVLVGHSMGVTYSVALSQLSPGIMGVVGLGNEAVADSVPPRNLALAMGVYDAFHTLKDMLEAVSESAGSVEIRPNEPVGDFSAGSARALLTSPLSDHGIEPLDPVLMRKTIEWAAKAMPGHSIRAIEGFNETSRAEARLVLFVAGGCGFMALLLLMTVPGRSKGENKKSGLMRIHFIPIAIGAVAGNISGPGVALACADISLAALLAGSVAAALAKDATPSVSSAESFSIAKKRFLRMTALLALVILCLLAGLLVNGVPAAARLGYIARIPSFLYHILLLRPYEGLCMVRAYAFYRYSEGWIPGVALGIVLIVEFIRPGSVTQLASKIAEIIVKALQIKGPFRLQTSPAGALGAVAAFSALAYMLHKRFNEGWLSGEAIRKMLIISLKFMILPLVLFIIAVNIHRAMTEDNE